MPTIVSRMKLVQRSGLLLPVIAVIAGTAAAFSAGQYVKERAAVAEHQASARYQTQPVVVASRDVRKGQQLDAATLAVRHMPREFLPSDVLAPTQAGDLLGARFAIDMRRGTPVVRAALQQGQTREPLAAQLDLGYRALTIQVDQVTSLAGQVAPGDRVDLLYSRGESGATTIVPLLEAVRVIATGGDTGALAEPSRDSSVERDFSTITLLVTAEDAARVVLAEQTGRLTLLLRQLQDNTPLDIRIRNSQQLLQAAKSLRGDAVARIELLTGGRGELQPARTWLFPGKTAVVAGEAL